MIPDFGRGAMRKVSDGAGRSSLINTCRRGERNSNGLEDLAARAVGGAVLGQFLSFLRDRMDRWRPQDDPESSISVASNNGGTEDITDNAARGPRRAPHG